MLTAAAALRRGASRAAGLGSCRALATSAPPAPGAAASAEESERKFLLGCYNADGTRVRRGLVIERGQGSTLYDSEGKAYLDWFAGIAVNALGHSDEGVAAVLSAQARKVQHVSNIFHSWEPLRLAELLTRHSRHFQKVFLCNSGTEANEGALKFARKAHMLAAARACAGLAPGAAEKPPAFKDFGCKAATPTACFTQGGMCGCWPQAANNDMALRMKPEVMAFKNGFHGRSMGSLAVTHKPAIRYPYGPFPADVRFARFNNIDDVHKMWTPKIGAVIVEPVQGEGGIYPADARFLQAIKDKCLASGALLIVDEVQCGLGRSGRLWAHEAYDVAPDMMTLAKPLAGGLPIGAVLMTEAVAGVVSPGDHGTTYGGNPLVAAVAEHVFARIAAPEFLAGTRARGAQLLAGCRALARDFPHAVGEVRGTLDGGLFVGVDLHLPFKALQEAAVARGLLLISCGENTVRICPPLVITEAEVARGLGIFREALQAAYGSAPGKK